MSTTTSKQQKLLKHRSPHPILGASDTIGEGDTYILPSTFSSTTTPSSFTALKNEIHWQTMSHAGGAVPRLVCVQGAIASDGSMPVYRHPSDRSLPLLQFSPMVAEMKRKVEEIVGHEMSHVLIQLYRGGEDFISEHSDKTLDIVRGSSIVNVSLGAQRVMRLRTKKSAAAAAAAVPGAADGDQPPIARKTQLVPLPHGSVFVLGLKSNEAWLHGINADKRMASELTADEKAFDGQRISLTFRHIGTFLSADERSIWGQGAVGKTKEEARQVVDGDEERNKQVVMAFGMENQMAVFEWRKWYGEGFDVLHFNKNEAEEAGPMPMLFLSGDEQVDGQVKGMLDAAGLRVHVVGVNDGSAGNDYRPEVCLRDIDMYKTQAFGVNGIRRYLEGKRSSTTTEH